MTPLQQCSSIRAIFSQTATVAVMCTVCEMTAARLLHGVLHVLTGMLAMVSTCICTAGLVPGLKGHSGTPGGEGMHPGVGKGIDMSHMRRERRDREHDRSNDRDVKRRR